MNEPQKIVVQPNLTVEVTKLLIMIQIMVLFVSIAEINVMTMLGVILMFLPTLIIIVPFTCVTIYAVVKTLIVHYSSKK